MVNMIWTHILSCLVAVALLCCDSHSNILSGRGGFKSGMTLHVGIDRLVAAVHSLRFGPVFQTRLAFEFADNTENHDASRGRTLEYAFNDFTRYFTWYQNGRCQTASPSYTLFVTDVTNTRRSEVQASQHCQLG